jgi:D-arabinose 1-dehydrogenase-like Zn-dependent alcohol dehydrogenase
VRQRRAHCVRRCGGHALSIILGHEGVGRIEQLGAGVSTDYAGAPVSAGDLVYWSPIAACHRCHACTVREETPCENSRFFEHARKPNWGSYANYAWLPNGLAFFKLPEKATPEAVIALGCALPTVLRGFERCQPFRRALTSRAPMAATSCSGCTLLRACRTGSTLPA